MRNVEKPRWSQIVAWATLAGGAAGFAASAPTTIPNEAQWVKSEHALMVDQQKLNSINQTAEDFAQVAPDIRVGNEKGAFAALGSAQEASTQEPDVQRRLSQIRLQLGTTDQSTLFANIDQAQHLLATKAEQ